jgi:hypothetical protein
MKESFRRTIIWCKCYLIFIDIDSSHSYESNNFHSLRTSDLNEEKFFLYFNVKNVSKKCISFASIVSLCITDQKSINEINHF